MAFERPHHYPPKRPVRVERPVVNVNRAAEIAKAKAEVAKKLAAKTAADRKKLCKEEIDIQYDAKKFKDSYATFYTNGDFSEEEKAARTEQLEPGVILKHDIGLTFYRVQKGDTLYGIKQKLAKFPAYSYVKNLSKSSITSFNIPDNVLHCDTWIPLPPLHSPVEGIDNAKMIENIRLAIKEMKTNPVYGPLLVDLLRTTSVDQIVLMMMTCAKTESSNKDFDRLALFRYENGHKCFSYSVFHILMDDAGLKARQNLGMTEGQTLLPKNSAKLFLAFLMQKSPNGFQKLFPVDKHIDQFATFYNGDWKRAAKIQNAAIDKRNAKNKKKGKKLEEHVLPYPTRFAANLVTVKAMLRI